MGRLRKTHTSTPTDHDFGSAEAEAEAGSSFGTGYEEERVGLGMGMSLRSEYSSVELLKPQLGFLAEMDRNVAVAAIAEGVGDFEDAEEYTAVEAEAGIGFRGMTGIEGAIDEILAADVDTARSPRGRTTVLRIAVVAADVAVVASIDSLCVPQVVGYTPKPAAAGSPLIARKTTSGSNAQRNYCGSAEVGYCEGKSH